MEPGNLEKGSIFVWGWWWLKGLPSKPLAKVYEIARQTTKIGKDDPRRLIHSLKAGLALTFVWLFYYCQPLYSSFGVSTMWAVMTVVVVFEFSVDKIHVARLNRGLATLVAGALGFGAHHLVSLSGKTSEPILIGLFVFLQAVVSTFIRFFPKVKARYDYGMLIFILTFCLVSIPGFRTDEIFKLAQKRLSTILIGASTCVIVSIFVCPIWAGEDLHKLVAQNIEKLGSFLEDIMDECFRTSEAAQSENGRPPLVRLNSVLVDSKSSEETLANFARWEAGHGQFMYFHPWKQYLKIGNLTRQCACRSGKALKELAWAVETMTRPSSSNPHIGNLKIASKNLKSLLKSGFWEEYSNLLQVIPVAAVAALLIDTVAIVEHIADAVT
ncbi:hypothetical protein Pfo_007433 [Paulownia fortunei]|nr:hypothetical protein Pfo_007433 [Paulownia fortunei]